MRYLKTLLRLKNERVLNHSQVPKALLQKLLDESLVSIDTLSPNRRKVHIKDAFLKVYDNLEMIQDATCRADLLSANTDTKKKKISPQDGLYLAGRCSIGNISLPISKDSSLFLKDIPTLNKTTLVVGVENFENLIYFQKQLQHFRQDDILFVFRNKKMLEFFANIENEIVYFCDFDLAGIHIYENEILPKNQNIKLFIPKNIEESLKKFGSKELYEKQLNKYNKLKSSNKQINNLINLIHKYQKSLEQEFFLL